ncbi:MAG: response regulator receiver modulated metal dependent phosphohydrolase [Bacillales bacterium]|jgi:putative two-component system response regulator|nr:response regulator receiver modulated metal dependent phosphohydrolase [Bacillales bacterium]
MKNLLEIMDLNTNVINQIKNDLKTKGCDRMFEKKSILIVDDQKENITALKSLLNDQYEIYAALNGKAALRVMNVVRIDLVLLDLVMPIMDGFETLRLMKMDEKLENIPVIFITSALEDAKESMGLSLGAADYIKKPYNPTIINIKVKNQLENKMYRESLEQLVEIRTQEIEASREAIIMGMSYLAEGRDQETGGHIKRMQQYTRIIANQIVHDYPEALTKEDAKSIVLLAPLHDIGKVNIPDSILLKEDKLTSDEFEMMKAHTTFGAEVLKKTENLLHEYSNFLKHAIDIAEGHHEKYDGSGYPKGLKGDEIPLSACISSIADIYDALTSERPYKRALSHEEALDIIYNGDGRVEPQHFNPIVLESFRKVANRFNEIRQSSVRLYEL